MSSVVDGSLGELDIENGESLYSWVPKALVCKGVCIGGCTFLRYINVKEYLGIIDLLVRKLGIERVGGKGVHTLLM